MPVFIGVEYCLLACDLNVSAISIAAADFSTVSSQYGPGPVVGWLLAALSVMISRILEKENEKTCRFSADYFTTLFFPIVAIGDLTLQLYRYPGLISEITSTSDFDLRMRIHELEAPLALIELMMMVSVFLGLIAMHRWDYGGEEIWIINLAGLGLETYLLTTGNMHKDKKPYQNFSRSFMAHSIPQVIFAWILTMLPMIYSVERQFNWTSKREPTDLNDGNEQQTRDIRGSDNGALVIKKGIRKVLDRAMATCLSAVFWVVLASMAGNAITFLTFQLEPTGRILSSKAIKDAVKVFFYELLPCTPNSILDLDQMVPVIGGACLLLLNTWRIGKRKLQKL